MRYGKLIDGKMNIHSAINPILTEDGRRIISSNSELLLEYGYKELVYTSPNIKDGYITSGYTWAETDKQYIQTWNYTATTEEVYVPSIEERLAAMESAMIELVDMLVGGDA